MNIYTLGMNNITLQEEKVMTKLQYAKAIAAIIGGEVKEVEKANGVKCVGVMKDTGTNMAPNVYIDDLYDAGVSIEDAVAKVKATIEDEGIREESFDWIYDFEKVKPKLRARLYNQKTKTDLYKSARPYGFDDLIIIPYLVDVIPTVDGMASIRVKQDLFEMWEITEDELFDIAMENSKADIERHTMADMLSQIMDAPLEELPFGEIGLPMYVITNKSKMYGAIGILSELDFFKRRFPNGFSVIPSSVHEVIVVESGMEGLSEMIGSVNAEAVREEEQLGEHAYYFGERG